MFFGKRKKRLGIFFLNRKKKSKHKEKSVVENIIENLPKIREAMKKLQAAEDGLEITDGEIIKRMYDFHNTMYNNDGITGFTTGFNNPVGVPVPMPMDANNPENPENSKPKDTRENKKPKQVVGELERVPSPDMLKDLDEKIALFEDKASISTQRYAKEEIKGFLQRLKNRKKYEEHKEFFLQFPNTTGEKIDDLLEKYKLVMRDSQLFIPTFPKEATQVMKAYTQVCRKISGQNPVFYVIAQEQDFKEKYRRLDPILLVQSPFGFYWQILGAWDEEMLLLTEL